jgi:hypothetical protein
MPSLEIINRPAGVAWNGIRLILKRSRAEFLARLIRQGSVSPGPQWNWRTLAVYASDVRRELCHAGIPFDVICKAGTYKLRNLDVKDEANE